MSKPRASDFEYPNALDDVARKRFDAFEGEVDNLVEAVGPTEGTIDLNEKSPYTDALTLLEAAVDGSESLDRASKDFLLSKKGSGVVERAAERIVGAYFRRIERS